MKTLKKLDLFIQVLMLTISIPYAVYGWGGSDSFFHPYYAVGAWQLTSFGIHLLIRNNLFFKKERVHYGVTNLWILGLGLASFLTIYFEAAPILLCYLFAMLIVGPVMAIWYASICFREIKLMTNKEMVHLK